MKNLLTALAECRKFEYTKAIRKHENDIPIFAEIIFCPGKVYTEYPGTMIFKKPYLLNQLDKKIRNAGNI